MPLDIALTNYNQQNGRYNFALDPVSGDVMFDETQAYPVMTAVMCTRYAYWAARLLGSLLFTVKNLTSRTPSQATAAINDALQALQPDLIKPGPVVQAVPGPGRFQLSADVWWTTPAGVRGKGKAAI